MLRYALHDRLLAYWSHTLVKSPPASSKDAVCRRAFVLVETYLRGSPRYLPFYTPTPKSRYSSFSLIYRCHSFTACCRNAAGAAWKAASSL